MAEDPNAGTGPLTMDKAGLQAFLDNRVEPFADELRKITLDDPTLGPAMGTLIGDADIDSTQEFDSYAAQKPLAIGLMTNKDNLHSKGAALNEAIAKTAKELTVTFEEQTALFKDIVDNLEASLETLFTTQGNSLTEIDGQEFLDVFEDVEADMSGGQGGDSDEEDD